MYILLFYNILIFNHDHTHTLLHNVTVDFLNYTEESDYVHGSELQKADIIEDIHLKLVKEYGEFF